MDRECERDRAPVWLISCDGLAVWFYDAERLFEPVAFCWRFFVDISDCIAIELRERVAVRPSVDVCV